MAEYRTYRPRRSRSGNSWGRVVVVLVVVAGLVLLGKWMFGGRGTSTTNTNDTDIDLVSDQTTNTTTNENTNSATGVTNAWDGFSVSSCPNAISTLPTAKQIVLTVGLSAANDQVTAALEALKQANVPADFLVSGSFATDHPDVVKQVADAGYVVYSQSFDGTDLAQAKDVDVTEQITKADAAITAATGSSPKPIFRPPAGSYSAKTVALLHEQGYCTVLWTVDSYDWQQGMTVEDSQARVLAAVEKQTGGSIVALHAGYDLTPSLIPSLVTALQTDGYTMVTLADALNQS